MTLSEQGRRLITALALAGIGWFGAGRAGAAHHDGHAQALADGESVVDS